MINVTSPSFLWAMSALLLRLWHWHITEEVHGVLAIADVAVTKRHQRLDEILIYIYQHFTEKLSEVVFKKTMSCNTPAKLDTIMYAQHMLVINAQEMGAFHTAYACYKCVHFWQRFLVNNFADFAYSAGKKIESSSSHWWRFVTATTATAGNWAHNFLRLTGRLIAPTRWQILQNSLVAYCTYYNLLKSSLDLAMQEPMSVLAQFSASYQFNDSILYSLTHDAPCLWCCVWVKTNFHNFSGDNNSNLLLKRENKISFHDGLHILNSCMLYRPQILFFGSTQFQGH